MSLFQTATGVYIPNHWKLAEGFEVTSETDDYCKIKANVSFERLCEFFESVVATFPEPLFLILESPCNQVKEETLRKRPNDPFHYDLYYSQLHDRTDVLKLYSRYADLLLNDGFIRFGIASQSTKQEIFVAHYKIVHLRGPKPNKFLEILAQFNIPHEENLVTAWDLFTEEDCGVKHRYRNARGDIYDMIEQLLREEAIFFVKTVEG